MELRSTRSRSKTPIVYTSISKESVEDENHLGLAQTITRTTRSTTTKTTYSSGVDDVTNINHMLDTQSSKPLKTRNSKSEKVARKSRYKTSDYSSEEGDQQVTSSESFEQNSTNQFLEDSRRSVSRSSNISALDYYRAAGDYWNKFPKTDYTYSRHSKDRTEIAPGVVAMPNMSRKSLHSYDSYSDYVTSNKHTNTESFDHEEVDYSIKSNNSKLSSTYNSGNGESYLRMRSRALFSNNNYGDKYTSSYASSTTRKSFVSRMVTTITSIFVTIFTWISSAAYYVYFTQNSGLIWFGKKFHTVTTRLMLWDTWLLKSSTQKKKLSSLLALCLIPLGILAGWWLLSGLGPALYGAYFNSTSPLRVTTNANYDNVIVHDSSSNSDYNSAAQIKIEERIIKEKLVLEPPKAGEIAAELTSQQLQEIADSVKSALALDIETRYNSDSIVAKIMQDPSIQDVINNYNRLTVKLEENRRSDGEGTRSERTLGDQQMIIDSLREEVSKVKLQLLELEKERNAEIASMIAQMRLENQQNNARLTYQLSRCCRHSFIHIESYIRRILKDLLGAPSYVSTQKDISDWLHSTFVAKQDLEARLSNLTKHLKSDYDMLIENNGQIVMDKVISKISAELNSRIEKAQATLTKKEVVGELKIDSLTDDHIRKIVRDSLAVYDADKTGLVDYALESAGGQVLSTRCTESYQARTAVVSIFGVPLWYPTNTPRTVITPGVVPGECWAFQNFPGFLLIKLAAPTKIEAFSLEHISKMLAPNGKIDSAPKEFSVHGLRNETDREPLVLGQYVYDADGPSLQYFAAAVHGLVFNIIELRVHSNHGNPNYTCLYRFRVHGSLGSEPT